MIVRTQVHLAPFLRQGETDLPPKIEPVDGMLM